MRTSLRSSSDAGQINVGQASSLSKKRRQAGSLSYIMAFLTTVLSLTACAPQKQKITVPQDKPLASFQTNLLQTAFDIATAIPVVPHIKDRSKAQAAAATACFKLDQPQRALGYIEKIGDWRRGSGYADYAFYCTQHGFTNDTPHYIKLAEEISTVADQDWRRDRIKVRIAQTHLILGQTNQMAQFLASLENSESGKVEQVEATLCSEEDFDAQMKVLDELIASRNFDLIKNTLYACAELYDRFYDDTEKRSQMEDKIRSSWNTLPIFIRIELLMKLTEISLQHTDYPKALALVNDAKALMDDAKWRAEFHVPTAARLAALRFRAGDRDVARAELLAEEMLFNEKQSEILNMDRADTLIQVAEAFYVMGDSTSSQAIYKQAVETAIENPNSRPCAEDLSAICLSMALNKVEPDEALWNRIKEIQSNLGDPW